MANTIDDALLERMVAQGFKYLRRKTSILGAVYTEPMEMMKAMARKGTKVTIPLPAAFAEDATDRIAGPTPPQPPDMDLTDVQLTLDQHKEKSFKLTDLEVTQLQNGTMGEQFMGCMDALSRTIVKHIWATARKGAYWTAGTAGVTPFQTSINVLGDGKRILDTQGFTELDRSAVVSFDAETNLVTLDKINRVDSRGDAGFATLTTGKILMPLLGMGVSSDAYTPTHTTTGGSGFLVNGANQTGSTLTVDTGSTAPAEGDVFTIAGNTQPYVIRAGATTTSWSVYPDIATAPADDAAITFVGSHTLSLMMHRHGLVFGTRIAEQGAKLPSEYRMESIDPMTGLPLTFEIKAGHGQTMVYVSCLYGAVVGRRNGLIRLLG